MSAKFAATGNEMSHFAKSILDNKYAHTKTNGNKENWLEICERVCNSVMGKYVDKKIIEKVLKFATERKIMFGGRFYYAAGRPYPQINNCFLFNSEDSREAWADTMHKNTLALSTGGGVGNVFTELRGEGVPVKGMGGFSTGPLALANMVNEVGRYIIQGGSRRSAIWAGLGWQHPDIGKFIKMKDWSDEVKAMKLKDFNFPAQMDMTNISVGLDDEFFDAYKDPNHQLHKQAYEVYWNTVQHACETGEPGFSIDIGENAGEHNRNACTELSSSDDKDMCLLSSLNLARFDSIDEFEEAVYYTICFMLCGTMYSPLPIQQMYAVREKNRRLGLGLMGIHEWLLRRGYKYAENDELAKWLEVYARAQEHAKYWCEKVFGISTSVKTRAIAPTGTISIIGETSSGIEPIFAVAQKRRYLCPSGTRTWKYQYIIDACAARLIADGVNPKNIEDSYELFEDYERRMNMQAWVQGYVDHGISSTINMPKWGSSLNNEDTIKPFGNTLLKYLPRMRGWTVYPDQSRGGQPLNRVSYETAIKHLGKEFTEGGEQVLKYEEVSNERSCVNGVCGI